MFLLFGRNIKPSFSPWEHIRHLYLQSWSIYLERGENKQTKPKKNTKRLQAFSYLLVKTGDTSLPFPFWISSLIPYVTGRKKKEPSKILCSKTLVYFKALWWIEVTEEWAINKHKICFIGPSSLPAFHIPILNLKL